MSDEPKIIIDDYRGQHNRDWDQTRDRLERGKTYKDLSTICVIPAIGNIPPRIVQSWMGLFSPMNQKFIRIFITGMEVGDAYNHAVECILGNPDLSKWKYMLTLETDNAPPPDGLIKLLEDIENGPWHAVGGLYFTKGESGAPMCYGSPASMPKNFIPFLPPPNSVTECNGLGMGFTLFRIEDFKKMPKPWFKTVQEYEPGVGARAFTQDLWHFNEGFKCGFRNACSSRVLVGHLDKDRDIMW